MMSGSRVSIKCDAENIFCFASKIICIYIIYLPQRKKYPRLGSPTAKKKNKIRYLPKPGKGDPHRTFPVCLQCVCDYTIF